MLDASAQRLKRSPRSRDKKYEAKISSIRFPFRRHKRAKEKTLRNVFCEKGLTLQSTSMDVCQVALKQKPKSD